MSSVWMIILCVTVVLAFLGLVFGLASVVSQAHRGKNWGENHMREMGLQEEPKDEMRPF